MTEHLQDAVTEAGTIADLAERAAKVDMHVVDVRDVASDPVERRVYGRGPDGSLVLVDQVDVAQLLRNHANQLPDRRAGTVAVHTPQSLVDYAKRHLDSDGSTLWGDVDAARITVVLNDHGPSAGHLPDWGDHRAVLALKASPEWSAWTAINEKWLTQEQLAEFLEEHLAEIVRPDGSDLLEVARTFQATVGATFRRAQSLHSGQVQLTWQEDGEAKAGSSGQMEVPREFTVALRPFAGTDPVEVTGMFRYRVTQGQLALGIRLLNLDDHRRAAVEDVLATVADALALTALEGVAPEARR
jgi:uncharacterized protein YfdQ (DUF2303 family)